MALNKIDCLSSNDNKPALAPAASKFQPDGIAPFSHGIGDGLKPPAREPHKNLNDRQFWY
jgi:hypothetical protein